MTSAEQPLTAATRRRSEATRQRAVEALRRLDHDGVPVTYTAVADAAGVSRSWLYRQPDLVGEIEQLRRRSRPRTEVVVPAAQRGSEASLTQRVADLLDANRKLQEDNRRLREQVAVLLGHQRAAL